MSVLVWSLIANAILAMFVIVLFFRAKARIVEEKMATFAGLLNVMTSGLGAADAERRWDSLALGMKWMLGGGDEEQIRANLVRASIMSLFRSETAAADLSEHLRALTLTCMKGDSEAENVWSYIDGVIAQEPGFEEEVCARFSPKQLAQGQFQLEANLFRMYRAALDKRSHRILTF
jgi:hypothetical protein